jgi:hypothetical protein
VSNGERSYTVIDCDGGQIEVVRWPDGRAAILVKGNVPLPDAFGDAWPLALLTPLSVGIGLGPNDRRRLVDALGDGS